MEERLIINDFGPIKYIDLPIKRVNILIGDQGTGKSTVAKLISTFTWIEKALVRGDYNKKWFERKNKLKKQVAHLLILYVMILVYK